MASKHIKAVIAAAAATAQEIPVFVNGASANAAVAIGAEDQLVIDTIQVGTTVAGEVHIFHGTDGTNSDSWRTLFRSDVSGSRQGTHVGLRVLPKGHKLFVIGPATGSVLIQAFGVIN